MHYPAPYEFPQMGPSGSGKTTLLDVLAGRKNAGTTEGTIAFAGQKPTPQFLRRYAGEGTATTHTFIARWECVNPRFVVPRFPRPWRLQYAELTWPLAQHVR